MTFGYHTASEIASPFADPTLLAPDAVRCLWVRPVSDDPKSHVPTVIFRDGTHHPLSPCLNEMDARRACLKVGMVYDWPVWDKRQTGIGSFLETEKNFHTLPAEDRLVVDGQYCLTMQGLGRLLANIAHAEERPLGEAVSKVTHQIVRFFDMVKEQTSLAGVDMEDAMQSTINTGFEQLCVLYPDEPEDFMEGHQTEQETSLQTASGNDVLILASDGETLLSCQPFLLFDQCLALLRNSRRLLLE
ncbi:hypothetical protein [Acetobacter sp.]|uniref:hypothetical protein n=1 Tax=Acetobacter sp. TaxID=440 RepID=UPI0025B8BB36|nr:hypothetical protein [Acetobacter sp.]MCH4090453.1 hypothetical protein [Acetobacter sp.]MCI1299147.1 hypothetical protein [Acetobacter sp.]MCI1315694.1 hypothetical protein [Acetobacter sp.]